jgi:methionine sulfoxide reductase heme-binding subunit
MTNRLSTPSDPSPATRRQDPAAKPVPTSALVPTVARRGGRAGRLGGGTFLAAIALVGIVLVFATDQIVPASSAHQAQLRIWLASRAAGLMSLVLLAFQIIVGLVLSHPVNKTTWKLSKRLFPWHENVWLFILGFLGVHIASILLDPFAGVSVAGAFVPGLSSYRSAPVALGTLSLYALLLTGITARYTKLLPAGAWLTIHRVGIVVFVLGWMHGLLAGTDSMTLIALYTAIGGAVGGAAAYRYWVTRQGRPTFSSSLPEGSR